jgi:hypothetical protein
VGRSARTPVLVCHLQEHTLAKTRQPTDARPRTETLGDDTDAVVPCVSGPSSPGACMLWRWVVPHPHFPQLRWALRRALRRTVRWARGEERVERAVERHGRTHTRCCWCWRWRVVCLSVCRPARSAVEIARTRMNTSPRAGMATASQGTAGHGSVRKVCSWRDSLALRSHRILARSPAGDTSPR